uniref:Fungal lipase-type domain-containing protein n=1 Tax=Quercus lobata TaxID=97700 RepID=A0A7N2MRA1_QUELO
MENFLLPNSNAVKVRQELISVSIPSTVPSNFLLVAWIDVCTAQTSFLINQLWVLAGAFTKGGGTRFPWSEFTPCFPMGPIPFTSPGGGYLGIAYTRVLVFPLKLWNVEDRVEKAVNEKKQLVFTGHSTGGSIAILATIWFLEKILETRYLKSLTWLFDFWMSFNR